MSIQLKRAISLVWAYYYFRFVLFDFFLAEKAAVIHYSSSMDLIETPKEVDHIIIFHTVRLLVTMPCYYEFIKGKDHCGIDITILKIHIGGLCGGVGQDLLSVPGLQRFDGHCEVER
jgi:hypothetical protein